MMNLLFKHVLYPMIKVIGANKIKKMIATVTNYAGIDLLTIAYNNIGILKFENYLASGEHFLITNVLRKYLTNVRPVIFDVGANVGKYSLMLVDEFPNSQIFAFEPNENTYIQLKATVGNSVKCINIGLGAEEETAKIFTYADNLTSSHASIYNEVFSTFHKRDCLNESDIKLTTLDLFCEREKVSKIDFLKIDTEGNELNVLKGARKMLANGQIKMIQFEFGECDVFSRVFLKDFYHILSEYNIYRLDTERLIPLFEYNSSNEIFRYQNLLAVRKDSPLQ